PVILIAGGYGSDFDLREWAADVLANTEAVILIGASADQLAQELRAHPNVVRAQNLEEAVSTAAGLARLGSVVLLSPAYKSFDMFKDFEDRGNQFKELVRKRFAARIPEAQVARPGRALPAAPAPASARSRTGCFYSRPCCCARGASSWSPAPASLSPTTSISRPSITRSGRPPGWRSDSSRCSCSAASITAGSGPSLRRARSPLGS